MKRLLGNFGAHLLLALVWLLHWLPLPLLALLGRGFGHLLHLVMPGRVRGRSTAHTSCSGTPARTS